MPLLRTITLRKATVIHGCGPDTIVFEADLPDGCFPYTGNQCVQMTVAADTGEKYMEKYFAGLEMTVIDRTK